MNIHTEIIDGKAHVTATRGQFTVTVVNECETLAYFAAIAKLNEKAKGVYAPQYSL